jgi:hypothetical protein
MPQVCGFLIKLWKLNFIQFSNQWKSKAVIMELDFD